VISQIFKNRFVTNRWLVSWRGHGILLLLITSAVVLQSFPGTRTAITASNRNREVEKDVNLNETCTGNKNESRLKLAVRVWDGRIRIDKTRSTFEPSDLFKCRGRLANNHRKSQQFERVLLDDLDEMLLARPRFYLALLTNKDREALITYLSADEREELIPFLKRSEKVKFFLYMPAEVQLEVVNDLNSTQKKDFFASRSGAELYLETFMHLVPIFR
jgi:hypothetical protein